MSYKPEGFHTITPYLVVKGAAKAIELYQNALGAKVEGRMDGPDGSVMHACLQIGSSKIFLGDENEMMKASADPGGTRFYVYVEDVDAAHKQAVAAGMSEKAAPEDMFWGDRTAVVIDSSGHSWTLATHQREVTPEEMAEAMKQMA